MSISSEIIVKAFIKMANKNFLDAYLINKGNNEAGEIFLKVSNLFHEISVVAISKQYG